MRSSLVLLAFVAASTAWDEVDFASCVKAATTLCTGAYASDYSSYLSKISTWKSGNGGSWSTYYSGTHTWTGDGPWPTDAPGHGPWGSGYWPDDKCPGTNWPGWDTWTSGTWESSSWASAWSTWSDWTSCSTTESWTGTTTGSWTASTTTIGFTSVITTAAPVAQPVTVQTTPTDYPIITSKATTSPASTSGVQQSNNGVGRGNMMEVGALGVSLLAVFLGIVTIF
ncbi:uncharacterized protein L3040_000813 [Drepanopeziza brunnea f. sp. 'multigermtubi']|uniref:uncharacterized protein n=1 Tax=Drepanopeziza brunnea f. sp. 'multigermtubi' TaxID=698441 RepID=UPI00239B82F2|nr:hypothetical protein L3040_000813 [Drepanopeziza brunnea f. sp. 'multigermtubi']